MKTTSKLLLFFTIFSCIYFFKAEEVQVPANKDTESDENATENLNNTVPQDLYVIKTVVYEVGILTDALNDTDFSNETLDQLDLSFPLHNGTIDLSHIPVPIQTNVSGVTVTGLLPGSDLASILLPPAFTGLQNPVLPQKQVTVTQNISTTNPEEGSQIVSNLPKLLGLTLKNKTHKDASKSKEETP